VDKSRVQTAGLIVGEVRDRRLQGNLARVTLRLKPDLQIWSNATLFKKSSFAAGRVLPRDRSGLPLHARPARRSTEGEFPPPELPERDGASGLQPDRERVEAVTTGEILTNVNETLPILRDILLNVRHITEGPLQDTIKEVQADIAKNSVAAERLLGHIDEIAADIRGVTHGAASDDLKRSVENVREITENIKQLVAGGAADGGQTGSASGKIRRDLDKFADSLDKLNASLRTSRTSRATCAI